MIYIKVKNKTKKLFKIIKKISTNIKDDNISAYSAQCSYYTILSFIPFLILLITIIQYTKIEQETLYLFFSKIVPSSMSQFVIDIVKEVYSKSIGTISISILFIILPAGRGFLALVKGLKHVYGITDERNTITIYTIIKDIVQTIVFIILIIIGLMLLVFGNFLIVAINENFKYLEFYNIFENIFAKIGLIFLTVLIFLFLYKSILNYKFTFKSQIVRSNFWSNWS